MSGDETRRGPGHLRNMALTAGGTMGSRVLGLFRDQLVAAFFGTSLVAGAFILAFQIPNLFRRLLGEGALTTALVPVMAEERKLGGDARAFVFLNLVLRRVAPAMVLVTGVFVALFAWLGSNWADVAPKVGLPVTPTEGGSDYALAAKLTAVCMPYMPLICVAALFTAALNMLGRFALTSLSAVWLNIAMIVGLGGFGFLFATTMQEQVLWLCAGALVGGLVQLLAPAWGLWRLGWRPSLREPACSHGAWAELKVIFVPALLGAGVQQINLFVTRFLAFSVDDRSLTIYYLANRVVELPVGVFAVTVSTVIFPALAAHAAKGDSKGLASDFAHGMRLIYAINIAACAGLVALAEPILRLLFQYGKFTAQDTALTVPVLMIFALTIPFYGVVGLCGRALSAMRDTRTQMRVAVGNLALNAVLAPLLGWWLKAPGLALANLVAVAVQAYVLSRAVRRRDEFVASESLWSPLMRVVLASLAMGLLARAGWHGVEHLLPGTRRGAALGLFTLIPLCALVYFAMLRAMRYPEVDEILAVAKRKLRLGSKR